MMKLALCTLVLTGGVALADDAAKKKAPPKSDDKAAEKAKPAEKPSDAPKPPEDVEALAKRLSGAWACTGNATMGGKPVDFKATMTHRLDLDRWWVQSLFTATIGKAVYKFSEFTTFEKDQGKWYRVGIDNLGGSWTAASSGLANDKTTWEGEQRYGGKIAKVRHTENIVSVKEVKVTGEMSMDNGKTWTKSVDVDCKKQ